MLDFWTLRSGESAEFVDGVIEHDLHRKPEFSLDIVAFQRILDNGLAETASKTGLSYFNDALIDVNACQQILNVLTDIDKSLNPSGARTENRVMADFFHNAVKQNLKVITVCD